MYYGFVRLRQYHPSCFYCQPRWHAARREAPRWNHAPACGGCTLWSVTAFILCFRGRLRSILPSSQLLTPLSCCFTVILGVGLERPVLFAGRSSHGARSEDFRSHGLHASAAVAPSVSWGDWWAAWRWVGRYAWGSMKTEPSRHLRQRKESILPFFLEQSWMGLYKHFGSAWHVWKQYGNQPSSKQQPWSLGLELTLHHYLQNLLLCLKLKCSTFFSILGSWA